MERQALRRRCSVVVPGFRAPTPAEEFRLMSEWCDAHDVAHDIYGEGALIADFEMKIAALLGKPAAAFMPSGVMAQLAAVRIWTQRAGLPRFGLHPTSHLILHENEAYEALFGLHGVKVGHRLRPMLAADLAACPEPMACLLVELPIREAGGQLPSWDDLQALQALATDRRIPLHMDGARLWESAAFYGRTYAEIAAGFASVYVSTYKAIGGVAGAVLAGKADFIAEARLWRRRMGGTLVHQSPMIVSAAMRFDERLALLPACFDRALALAAALAGETRLRVNQATPQTNMMHLFFKAPAEAVNARRDDLAEAAGVWAINDARPAEVPGWSLTELYIGDTLLDHDDAHVAAWLLSLLD
jgi:threonine aldolase